MNQIPERQNLTLYQGLPWSEELTLLESLSTGVPIDLTGYAAEAQIRVRPDSDEIIETITVTFAADRTTGVLTLSLSSDQTAALPTRLLAYYDVRLTKSDDDTATVVPVAGTIATLPATTKHEEQ